MASRKKPMTKAQLENFIDELDDAEEDADFSEFDDGKKFIYTLFIRN